MSGTTAHVSVSVTGTYHDDIRFMRAQICEDTFIQTFLRGHMNTDSYFELARHFTRVRHASRTECTLKKQTKTNARIAEMQVRRECVIAQVCQHRKRYW
jgi:hypothetical protein